jgi:hypothetical protein
MVSKILSPLHRPQLPQSGLDNLEAGQAVKVIYRNETPNPKTVPVTIMLGAQQDSQITTLPRSCVPRVTAQTKNKFTVPGLGKLVLVNRKAR